MSVIAEFCGNHNGDTELLWRMVDAAAKAGAWACKIQTFFADDLTPKWRHDYDRLKGLELDFETHANFASVCQNNGVIPMTSVYTARYLPMLSDCGFRHIKIGSPYCTDKQLIQMYTMYGFKMFVSTGGTNINKVPALHPIECVMHCVSNYPSDPDNANLSRIYQIGRNFPKSALGFSDHTCPVRDTFRNTAKTAIAIGVSYVEQHFTLLDRNQTKDGVVSISADVLKQLVEFDNLDREEQIKILDLGWLRSDQPESEKDLILRYRGRFKQ